MTYYFLLQDITLATEQTAFLYIFLTIIGVILFTIGGSWISAWLRPYKPYAGKLTTYESGVEPIGSAWAPINTRLYTIGIIFVLFELETILLFPWATVWVEKSQEITGNGEWNLYMAISGTFFVLILGIGLVYAIIKGRLVSSYNITYPNQLTVNSKVPLSYYDKINQQYASHNPATHNNID
jgi:NADH-quinone oxidoreductase subunit A